MTVDKKKMRVVNNKTYSVDGKALMQGRSYYTDDLAAQNSLTIKILRSPHAFAHIKNTIAYTCYAVGDINAC